MLAILRLDRSGRPELLVKRLLDRRWDGFERDDTALCQCGRDVPHDAKPTTTDGAHRETGGKPLAARDVECARQLAQLAGTRLTPGLEPGLGDRQQGDRPATERGNILDHVACPVTKGR